MLSRNQEQELAMKIIYNHYFNLANNIDKDLKIVIEEIADDSFENVSIFVKEVVVKTFVNLESSLALIENNLTTWTLDRMNKVTIAILLLGITEAKYIEAEGLFKAAIIDVCISLSKRFCAEKDYRFVNAFLDKVI